MKTNVFVCRQLARESKTRQLGVEFIDPQDFSAQVINSDPQHVESAITKVMALRHVVCLPRTTQAPTIF